MTSDRCFDEVFYLSHNPDVAASGLSAWQHYLSIGWRERRSPNLLFDVDWYLAGVADHLEADVEPLSHYVDYGWRMGLSPHPLFDGEWYLARYPDVAAADINPLSHYIGHGARERRSPHPLFDVDWYLGCYSDVAASGSDAVRHYLEYGWRERRTPHALFDPVWYAGSNPDLAVDEIDLLLHYIRQGWKEGRRPNPLFDPAWYIDGLKSSKTPASEPLANFITEGQAQGRWPSPLFDPSWYVFSNIDVGASGADPLAHYLMYGRFEERSPSRLIQTIRSFVADETSVSPRNLLQPFFATASDVLTTFPRSRASVHDADERRIYLGQYDEWLGVAATKYLQDAVNWSGRLCTFFAPTGVVDLDAGEGSRRRIQFVDESFDFMDRLYFSVDHREGVGLQLKRRGNVVEVLVPSASVLKYVLAEFLIARSPAIYVHSLFGLHGLTAQLCERRGKLIVDFHGVVPEEAGLSGKVEEENAAGLVEATLIKEADLVISVSSEMTKHFCDKYGLQPRLFAELPFVLPASPRRVMSTDDRGLHVTYVGGFQQWQCIDLMFESMAAARPVARYTLITSDKEEARRQVEQWKTKLPPVDIRFLPNNEVTEFLTTAQYGFALRSDGVVNRVACPTKIVEYLACGVLPILDGVHVGDFAALGLNYVKLGDFVAGRLPEEEVRASMAHANNWVLAQMWKMWRRGVRKAAAAMLQPGETSMLYRDDARGLHLLL